MKTNVKTVKLILVLSMLFLAITVANAQKKNISEKEYNNLTAQLKSFMKEKAQGEENLREFDVLDFEVFSSQKWERLHESHAENIIVNWPDGHQTFGIDKHIEDLKFLFVFAPDTRIKQHPIRLSSGNYTAVMGVMEGTFTEEMPIGDGKTIKPTGKSFTLPMATIGKWENGAMVEEWLFWDNKSYFGQIGL